MRKKTIIRNAVVMTMDDNIGTIPNACVLIDEDRISGVGKNIKDTEAEEVDATNMICMPGFVDTHRHTWATMLRGCSCCGSLDDYFARTIFTFGANFTPEDSYVSARLGHAETIDSGITTVHAWEHNIQTPAHARAVLQALREGPRGRFSYGPSNDPAAGSSFAKGTETVDFEDISRIRKEEFKARGSDLIASWSCLDRRGVFECLAKGIRNRSTARPAPLGTHYDDEATRRAVSRGHGV